MKSLWKCVVQGASVVCLSAGLSVPAISQDSAQVGIVRISKPRTTDPGNGRVTPVSAMQADGSCLATPGTPAVGATSDPTSGMVVASSEVCDGNCDHGRGKYHRQDWRYSDWQADNRWGSELHRRTQRQSLGFDTAMCRATGHSPAMYYHDASGYDMVEYFKCKFGYFIPSGGGGAGVPWVGHYARVYPVNPHYSDPRDGQIWAAQGYGVPIAVPLAPVVAHTYDYGWGIPSSRLTPVSHPAY
jgi:hypothetical protein